MTRYRRAVLLGLAPALLTVGLAGQSATSTSMTSAQTTSSNSRVPAAGLSSSDTLPDAPGAMVTGFDQNARGTDAASTPPAKVATRGSLVIPAGFSAQPLTASDKVKLGLNTAVSARTFLTISLAAGYSHLVDTAPHFGTDRVAFGKRFGAAAERSTIQTLLTNSAFSPLFHDDPRYYQLGRGNRLTDRVLHAAERVVVIRSDKGQQRINAPLLLGYAVAAGVNNAYYPDRDTGAKASAISYATSLGGAALGFQVSEFLGDALLIVHLRHE